MGAKKIMGPLHDYFAPDAADSVRQEVVPFSELKRATRTTAIFHALIYYVEELSRGRKWAGFPREFLRWRSVFRKPPFSGRGNCLPFRTCKGEPGDFCYCLANASFIGLSRVSISRRVLFGVG